MNRGVDIGNRKDHNELVLSEPSDLNSHLGGDSPAAFHSSLNDDISDSNGLVNNGMQNTGQGHMLDVQALPPAPGMDMVGISSTSPYAVLRQSNQQTNIHNVSSSAHTLGHTHVGANTMVQRSLLHVADVPPKRAMTAYQCYVAAVDDSFKERHPVAKTVELKKMKSQAWGLMSEEEKEQYTEMAHNDELRYENEYRNYIGRFPQAQLKKPKALLSVSRNRPSEPRSAYTVFVEAEYKNTAAKLCVDGEDRAKSSDIMAELARQWKDMSDPDREIWVERLEEAKLRYRRFLDSLTEEQRNSIEDERRKKTEKKRRKAQVNSRLEALGHASLAIQSNLGLGGDSPAMKRAKLSVLDGSVMMSPAYMGGDLQWQFQKRDSVWYDYGQDSCRKLSLAFQKYTTSPEKNTFALVKVHWNDVSYQVDFRTMAQIKTSNPLKVYRVRGFEVIAAPMM
eukprot:CFRG7938T1